jgi:hypothetical protein
MGYVWPCLTDIAAHFSHYTNVVVAIEEVVLVFTRSRASTRAVRGLVSLESGIAQHYDETLGVLVICGDRSVLLRDKLRELWWRHRLSSCRLNGPVSKGREMDKVKGRQDVDILARFLPRSGESREDGLSLGDSGLSGPAIVDDRQIAT